MAVGLIVGIGADPTPAEFEELLDRGLIPESGFQFVTLQLSAEEASDRSVLRTYYQGACANQGWLEGMAYTNALTFTDVVVAGRPFVIVRPEVAPDSEPAEDQEGSPERRPSQDPLALSVIRAKLDAAEATTLAGCARLAAVAIVHELPHQTGYPARHIAGLLVEQYKQSGWIPASLTVDDETPVGMLHHPGVSLLDTSEVNAIHASALLALAQDVAPRECEAISFSGENPALGPTYFSILAEGRPSTEAPQGAEEGPDAEARGSSAGSDAPERRTWSLRRRRS